MAMAAAAAFRPVTLSAALVTFAFEAVHDIDERPFRNLVPGQVVRGTYTFDSATPPTTFGTTVFYTGTIKSASVELVGIGTATSTGTADIIVGHPTTFVGSNPRTADFYNLDGIPMSGFSVGGIESSTIIGLFLTLEDDTKTAFSSTALPLVAPDISQFADEHSILLNFQISGGGQNASPFRLTSLITVPEPSAIWLLIPGLLILLKRGKPSLTRRRPQGGREAGEPESA